MDRNTKMMYDPEQSWLDNVAISNSNSTSTHKRYKKSFQLFKEFIGKTAAEILDDYEQKDERWCRRTYARYIQAFASKLHRDDYTPNSINTFIAAVQSFFKYTDLPLAFIPHGSTLVKYHNRPILKEEVMAILAASKPRERAFYTMMAQSGLRPETICKLKVKDIEGDIFLEEALSYRITVKKENTKGAYNEYFTFIGQDSVRALKAYFSSRPNINSNSFIFISEKPKEGATTVERDENGDVRASSKSFSLLFCKTLRHLKQSGLIDYKQSGEARKPSELRLYTLRKYFRNNAVEGKAGPEYVNFWMGHLSALGVDLHYFGQDVKTHQQIYEEYALPKLSLEGYTPSELEKEMNEKMTQKAKEIEVLKQYFSTMVEKMSSLQRTVDSQSQFISKFIDILTPEQKAELERSIRADTAARLADKSDDKKSDTASE
jgi:integrase